MAPLQTGLSRCGSEPPYLRDATGHPKRSGCRFESCRAHQEDQYLTGFSLALARRRHQIHALFVRKHEAEPANGKGDPPVPDRPPSDVVDQSRNGNRPHPTQNPPKCSSHLSRGDVLDLYADRARLCRCHRPGATTWASRALPLPNRPASAALESPEAPIAPGQDAQRRTSGLALCRGVRAAPERSRHRRRSAQAAIRCGLYWACAAISLAIVEKAA